MPLTIDVKYQNLSSYLESLTKRRETGTLQVTLDSRQGKKSYVLLWKQGQITYIGKEIPPIQDFVLQIIQSFKPAMVNAVLAFVDNHTTEVNSVRRYLEILVSINICTWKQIEELMFLRSIYLLEELFYLGADAQITFKQVVNFDISYGDNYQGLLWSSLKSELVARQKQWQDLAKTNLSPNAIPKISKNNLNEIIDIKVRNHVQQWVDGERTIGEIATLLNKDSLQVANTYSSWIKVGWLTSENSVTLIELSVPKKQTKIPKILSIDDSLIMQATIKRALADKYDLVFVDTGKSALEIIETTKFDLILLDVTMPDIDGLDLCAAIRSISEEWLKIPIIMLTARDKFSDKFKGFTAGTTEYLTKPFDADNLNRIIAKYVAKS
jgi:CheY-like chemotaxis protein